MTTEAERIFEKTMAGIPARYRTLTYDQARKAVQKKMTILTREPFQKTVLDRPKGYDTLDEAIEAIKEAEGCSGTDAMTRAARRHPDLLRKYNEEGSEQLAKAVRAANENRKRSSQAKQEWDLMVEGIMARRGVKRTTAMQIASRENPEKFRAYQES